MAKGGVATCAPVWPNRGSDQPNASLEANRIATSSTHCLKRTFGIAGPLQKACDSATDRQYYALVGPPGSKLLAVGAGTQSTNSCNTSRDYPFWSAFRSKADVVQYRPRRALTHSGPRRQQPCRTGSRHDVLRDHYDPVVVRGKNRS